MKESFFKRWPTEVLERTKEFIQRPGGSIVKRPDRHARGQDDGHPGKLDEKRELDKRFSKKNLDSWVKTETVEGLRTLHLDLSPKQADQPPATD